MCFFLPHKESPEKKHINKFLAPTQSRDNPAKLFMFMCFFLSLMTAQETLCESDRCIDALKKRRRVVKREGGRSLILYERGGGF